MFWKIVAGVAALCIVLKRFFFDEPGQSHNARITCSDPYDDYRFYDDDHYNYPTPSYESPLYESPEYSENSNYSEDYEDRIIISSSSLEWPKITCQPMKISQSLKDEFNLLKTRNLKEKAASFLYKFNQRNEEFGNDTNIFLLSILSIDWTVFINKTIQNNETSEEFCFRCIEKTYQQLIPCLESVMKLRYDLLEQYKQANVAMIIINTMAQIEKEIVSDEQSSTTGGEQSTTTDKQFLDMNLRTTTTFVLTNSQLVHIIFDCSLMAKEIFEKRLQFNNSLVTINESNRTDETQIGYITDFFTTITNNERNSQNVRKLFFSMIMTKSSYQKLLQPLSLYVSNQKYRIKRLFYLRPSIRLIETLGYLELNRYESLNSLVKLDSNIFTCSLPNQINQQQLRFHSQKPYNIKQKEAIIAASNIVNQSDRKKFQILMVQGPPGTGKTHTLIGMIKNIIANSSMYASDHFHILICAPSNGAIDEIGLRLIAEKETFLHNRSLEIVRIGQSSRIHEDMIPYELDQRINSRLKDNNKNKRMEIRSKIMKEADIILTTLTSCQHSSLDMFRYSSKFFRCLIIDEASQCVEPEILMPLVYKSITKVIMIGDPLQLPATVISNRAQDAYYGRSFFERFDTYFNQQLFTTTIKITILTEQYRMRKEICSFPSKYFYDSKLQTANGSGYNHLININPYFIFDIKDSYESSLQISRLNLNEVKFVCKLFEQIIEKIGYKSNSLTITKLPVSIGIITFYQEQKKTILSQLMKKFPGNLIDQIKIDTVDAFQGQECDIVILSCVRAPDEFGHIGTIGFVRSQQRMNVALTRARSLLCICLHKKKFSKNSIWNKLLSDARQRNRLFSISSTIKDFQLKQMLV
ncbi:uncharacterized protein LOC113797526 isoform X1 [Dermatophagoides pteronyssinus]|uniref:uncharacterized protein LOC113797526 isoform X1 n=1 Tax=Dermatophagoides pteronyssinus TaxID=6956 RepID=UPI003F666A62